MGVQEVRFVNTFSQSRFDPRSHDLITAAQDAGVARPEEELMRIAGDDHVISGPNEVKALFALIAKKPTPTAGLEVSDALFKSLEEKARSSAAPQGAGFRPLSPGTAGAG